MGEEVQWPNDTFRDSCLSLVGKDEADALALADSMEFHAKVVSRDGEPLEISPIEEPLRVRLTVVNGLVESVSLG